MTKKSKIESYPKTVNGERVNFPPELGADFENVLQDIANGISLKAQKKVSKK
jgi:hypothetical protein